LCSKIVVFVGKKPGCPINDLKKVLRSCARSRWWQWLQNWWQVLLGLLLLVVLARQIQDVGKLAHWWSQLQAASTAKGWGYLLLTLLLVPLNWGLESRKWYILLRPMQPGLAFGSVVRAVLAGIAVSLATPNRIGEYGGRALLFPAGQLREVVLSSLVGSWCQWLVFIMLGWPALVYQFRQWLGMASWAWLVPALLLPFVLLLLLWLTRLGAAPGPQQPGRRWEQMRCWRWLRLKLKPLWQLDASVLKQATGWAAVRFLTYTIQYLLLLWFFGASLTLGEGLVGIFSIYLIQAGIPLPPGLGVMTRSEIAILIWGANQIHPLAVLSATLTLYVLNLLLPALAGICLIAQKRGHSTKTKP